MPGFACCIPLRYRDFSRGAAVRFGCGFCAADVAVVAASFAGAGASNPQLASRLYAELLYLLEGADSRASRRKRRLSLPQPSRYRGSRPPCMSSRSATRRHALAARLATRFACGRCSSKSALSSLRVRAVSCLVPSRRRMLQLRIAQRRKFTAYD